MSTQIYQAINTIITQVTIDGLEALRVAKDPRIEAVDEPTYARLVDSEFSNGTIEVLVMSRLLADAPEFARGFIGVAFRADDNNSRFEGIYIRPTNGRCNDQKRRNSSTQYFSYPEYKFDRFRKENPGKYESYADMGLNEWVIMRIEVKGQNAKLFLNGVKQPALIISDLKHGANASGAIGLWVDIGTEGYFRDLTVKRDL